MSVADRRACLPGWPHLWRPQRAPGKCRRGQRTLRGRGSHIVDCGGRRRGGRRTERVEDLLSEGWVGPFARQHAYIRFPAGPVARAASPRALPTRGVDHGPRIRPGSGRDNGPVRRCHRHGDRPTRRVNRTTTGDLMPAIVSRGFIKTSGARFLCGHQTGFGSRSETLVTDVSVGPSGVEPDSPPSARLCGSIQPSVMGARTRGLGPPGGRPGGWTQDSGWAERMEFDAAFRTNAHGAR